MPTRDRSTSTRLLAHLRRAFPTYRFAVEDVDRPDAPVEASLPGHTGHIYWCAIGRRDLVGPVDKVLWVLGCDSVHRVLTPGVHIHTQHAPGGRTDVQYLSASKHPPTS